MLKFKHLFLSLLLAFSLSMLGTSLALAAVDDYTLTGGDMTALPNVGDGYLEIETITLTDVGGDDFAISEALVFTINVTDYPSVEFDNSATTLVIGGTCGHDNRASISFGDHAVTVTVDGGVGSCLAGETITIAGLGLKTDYAHAGPGSSKVLYTVDNSTTSSGSPVNSPSVNLTSGVGDLTSTNIEPENLFIGASTNHAVTFTTTARIYQTGKIKITYPSGFDISGASSEITNCTNMVCANWGIVTSGQVLTLTGDGTALTAPGALSFTIGGIVNSSDVGSTGVYQILTTDGLDRSLETDTIVAADEIIGGSSHASTIINPTNLAVTDHEDGGVLLTWTDPSGDDSKYINIYRGIDPYPVSGTKITYVSIGTEYYLDDSVEEGDIVTYFLRSTDNFNSSSGTDRITITVGSADGTTEEEAPDETSDEEGEEEAADEGSESDEDTGSDTDADTDDDSNGNEAGNGIELSDIETHWARNEIQVMVQAGVIQGNEDGTFAPNDNLNRAEGAALVYRILEDTEAADLTENPFFDVDMGEWYAPYVGYMKDLGIITGNPDGSYTPGENINRAEYVHVVMAVYEHLNGDAEDVELTDLYTDLDTGAWYGQVVSNATALGFVSGSVEDDGTYFNADASITRAEATVILYRMFGE